MDQKHYDECGFFLGEEHAHGEKGIIEYYSKYLNIYSHDFATKILSILIRNKYKDHYNQSVFYKRKPYVCGSDKQLKYCHLEAINLLNRMPVVQLLKDRLIFKITKNAAEAQLSTE